MVVSALTACSATHAALGVTVRPESGERDLRDHQAAQHHRHGRDEQRRVDDQVEAGRVEEPVEEGCR